MNEFDVFARFYDFEYGGYLEDVEFFINFARRVGSPVLDAACGTGRILIPLAQAGFAVTGVDVSPAMVAIANDKIVRNGLRRRAAVVNADLRDFTLRKRFKLAFVALNSFGHLVTGEDQLAVLNNLHAHLATGGLLIIDLFNPDVGALAEVSGLMLHDYSRVDPETGDTIVKFHSLKLNQASQLLDTTFFYDLVQATGEVKRVIAPFVLRFFFAPEIELLLERASFTVENVYGSYDLEEYTSNSPKLIVVARAA